MTRISKDPDERRGELINAAKTLFFTKGYEKTSITDIVNAVGVAKGLFYYYFESKQAILEAFVEETTQQALTVMRAVINAPDLTALEKWSQALDTTNSWKLARKDEMLAIVKIMTDSNNVRLQHRMIQRNFELLTPEFARIIEQGVQEGVFTAAYAVDSAEIILSIFNSSRDIVFDIMANPEKYADGAAIIHRKLSAIQAAIERVLGATPGSLPTILVDEAIVAEWLS